MPSNSLCELFDIQYPIIQAGMVWVSGAKLAAASSEAGVLGLLGAGSMNNDLLRSQIKKTKTLTQKNFGVNLPLIYKGIQEQIDTCLEEGVKIFFTSAGSPKKYTKYLKDHGAVVVHVCSSSKLAKKCEDAGCDAVVAEGFEAGGHNGRDEITSMCLIPQVVDAIKIPVIAAGGIVDGRSIAAALCLGASGVQMGTRFLMTKESSAHQNYKDLLLQGQENDTELCMKNIIPVRLFKNHFYNEIKELESSCAQTQEIVSHLGKGRAKRGMLEGEIDQGELEIGQAFSLIKNLPTTADLVKNLIKQYEECLKK